MLLQKFSIGTRCKIKVRKDVFWEAEVYLLVNVKWFWGRVQFYRWISIGCQNLYGEPDNLVKVRNAIKNVFSERDSVRSKINRYKRISYQNLFSDKTKPAKPAKIVTADKEKMYQRYGELFNPNAFLVRNPRANK